MHLMSVATLLLSQREGIAPVSIDGRCAAMRAGGARFIGSSRRLICVLTVKTAMRGIALHKSIRANFCYMLGVDTVHMRELWVRCTYHMTFSDPLPGVDYSLAAKTHGDVSRNV